jgi:protein-L-isoaspartate(D-aspartate) O-methyltransferase
VEAAAARLTDEQIHNVEVLTEDFTRYQPSGHFDRVLITGSMPLFDTRLPEWLKPDGKLVMILGMAPAMNVVLLSRNGDTYTRETLFETDVKRLENVPCPEPFNF